MRRATFVALATAGVITSATALSTVPAPPPPMQAKAHRDVQGALAHARAREALREGIEARYRQERDGCDSLGGLRRDRCVVDAHAARGRALLEAAAPYQRHS
jgi:hypothetical protein